MRQVSVIIPTFNYGRFIASSIESALNQTFAVAEIIVVDDGSTDETERVVRNFGDKVRYIKQVNKGVCSARNNGVANSTGDLIAFLDSDDTWLPEKIEKQVAKFNENRNVGLVHCGMREFSSENGETIAMYLEGQEGQVAEAHLLFDKPVINISGSVIMVSRLAFDAVDGFDTSLKVGEDWDFCYRVARKFDVGFVRESLVDYRNHGNNAHFDIVEMERSMQIVYQKAFETDDRSIRRLRRRAYGNLHTVLAGSYFNIKNYRQFCKHSIQGLWLAPQNFARFAAFPFRWFRRRIG